MSQKLKRFFAKTTLVGFILFIGSFQAIAATINVTTISDNTTDDADCTLREAVLSANGIPANANCTAGSAASPDEVTFTPTGTYVLTSGDLDITDDITITGNGTADTILDGNNANRIFDFQIASPSQQSLIRNITLQNGSEPLTDGGLVTTTSTNQDIRIENAEMTNGEAYSGGAVFLQENSNLELDTVTFSSNEALSAAGGSVRSYQNTIISNTSTVDMTDITVNDSTAATYGGFYHAGDNTTITIDNLQTAIPNTNEADYGGFISVTSPSFESSLTITDSNFNGGMAIEEGGAIYTNSTAVDISNTDFSNNTSSGSTDFKGGGAVQFLRGDISLYNVDMSSNTTSGYGGAINCRSCNINYDTGFTSSNSAFAGGAYYSRDSSLFPGTTQSFINLNLDLNVSTAGNGGAFYFEGDTETIDLFIGDSYFNLNSTTFDLMSGGAIAALNTNLTLDDNDFTHNTSTYGGAIYLDSLSTLISSTSDSFSYNEATESSSTIGEGGAIYSLSDNTLEFNDPLFDHNTAINSGGAICDVSTSGTITINDGDFSFNEADQGGAIYMDSTTGGISIFSTNFNDNTALTGSGGAIYSDSDILVLDGSTTPGSFINNSANGGSGGAVYRMPLGLATNEIDNYTFDGNSAANGGALTLFYGSTLIHNSIFKNNTADTGGALYLDSEDFAMYDDTLSNVNFENNTASSDGGAIYAENLEDGILDTSDLSAFGLDISTENFSLANLIFRSNETTIGVGGAITLRDLAFDDTGVFIANLQNVNFDLNTAGSGGSMLFAEDVGSLTNSTLLYNHGDLRDNFVNGGGFRLFNVLTTTLENLVFESNTSTSTAWGAAIYAEQGALNFYNSSVSDHTINIDNVIRLINNAVFFDNIDVGNNTATYSVIGMDTTGSFEMTNSELYDNTSIDFAPFAFQLDSDFIFTNNSVTTNTGDEDTLLLEADNVIISNNEFINNTNTNASSANLLIGGLTSAYISENLFYNNVAGIAGVGTILSPLIDFINNSVIENSGTLLGGIALDAGMISAGTANIINNTFSGNIGVSGGALAINYAGSNTATYEINHNTFAYNEGTDVFSVGGIANGSVNPATINLSNNLFSSNIGSSKDCLDYSATPILFNLIGTNLFEDLTGCDYSGTGFVEGNYADLEPLFEYSPYRYYHPLGGASLAFNLGTPGIATNDQAGTSRPNPLGFNPDVGSFEGIDTTSPIITEIIPVSTPTTDTTPDYTFQTEYLASLTYGGGCSSPTTTSAAGNTTITFDTLANGTYNCTITATDSSGNSSTLNISPFTIGPAAQSGGGTTGAGGNFPSHDPNSCNTVNCLNQQPVEETPEPQIQPEPQPYTPPTIEPPQTENQPSQPTIQNPPSPAPQGNLPEQVPTTDAPDLETTPIIDSSFFRLHSVAPNNISCNAIEFENRWQIKPDPSADFDGDGLSDFMECSEHTNPNNEDSDGDLRIDSEEVLIHGTNPNISDSLSGTIVITTPDEKQLSEDSNPLVIGVGPAKTNIDLYLLSKEDFKNIETEISNKINSDPANKDLNENEKQNLFNMLFTQEVQNILIKFITNKLNPENEFEKNLQNRILKLGTAKSDVNGNFLYKTNASLIDNTYLLIGLGSSAISEEVEFTINNQLNIKAPQLKTFDTKALPENSELLKGLKIEITPGRQKPVLTGLTLEPVKITAHWQSTLSASALIADSVNQEFRLASPTPLEPGEHKVYVTAYRLTDNAQAKSHELNFTIQIAKPFNWLEYWWLILIPFLMFCLFLLRKKNANTHSSESNQIISTSHETAPETSLKISPEISSETSQVSDGISTQASPSTNKENENISPNTSSNPSSQEPHHSLLSEEAPKNPTDNTLPS